MKIAFLHMTMGLSDRGSERAVHMVATGLARKHTVLMIQSGKVTPQKYTVKRVMPLSVAPSAAPSTIGQKIAFRLHLNESSRLVSAFTEAAYPALSRFRPDIIVAVNGGDQVRMVRSHFSSSRIVVFGHAGIGHDDLRNLQARPDLFIALTPAARNWAEIHSSSATKVVYIPNPIDTALFRRAKPVWSDLPRPVVLTVGALTGYKNILNVIEAIKKLNVSFILIGDGEQAADVADALRHVGNDFRWIKHVDPSEMPSYYRSANVFCFVPDAQESFGLVYLEAMAAGLPIVASDDTVRRGIIGESGYYVNPHDPESIAIGLVIAVQKDSIDYAAELKAYSLARVVGAIEKELYEAIA